jgi:hypothetical protein
MLLKYNRQSNKDKTTLEHNNLSTYYIQNFSHTYRHKTSYIIFPRTMRSRPAKKQNQSNNQLNT